MIGLGLLIPVALAAPLDDLRADGCLACHPGGAAGVGPDLSTLAGRTEHVRTAAGQGLDVVADEAYLRRALLEPDAEVVVGFAPGIMPPTADRARVDRLVGAITALSPAAPGSRDGLELRDPLFEADHDLRRGADKMHLREAEKEEVG